MHRCRPKCWRASKEIDAAVARHAHLPVGGMLLTADAVLALYSDVVIVV